MVVRPRLALSSGFAAFTRWIDRIGYLPVGRLHVKVLTNRPSSNYGRAGRLARGTNGMQDEGAATGLAPAVEERGRRASGGPGVPRTDGFGLTSDSSCCRAAIHGASKTTMPSPSARLMAYTPSPNRSLSQGPHRCWLPR